MNEAQAVLGDILQIQQVLIGVADKMQTTEGAELLSNLRETVLNEDGAVRCRLETPHITVRRRESPAITVRRRESAAPTAVEGIIIRRRRPSGSA